MSGISMYLHASLYVFKIRAITTITAEFDERVKCPEASCQWDRQHEIFVIECPQWHGTVCNQALREIISNYISTELEAAEREERQPDIVRYPQSRFDHLDSTTVEEQNEDEHVLQPPAVQGPVITTHMIITGEAEGKRVKLFPMHELPEGFLRRALSTPNPACRKHFTHGFTCRAVRWDNQTGWTFNGRDGQSSTVATTLGGSEFMNAVTYPSLEDTRERSDSGDEEELPGGQQVPRDQWKHVGKAPRVEDWLGGVGRTTELPLEEELDAPHQALNKPTPIIGRLIDVAANKPEQSDKILAEEIDNKQPKSFNDMFTGPTIAGGPADETSDSDEAIFIPPRAKATAPLRSAPAQRVDISGLNTVYQPTSQSPSVLRDQSNSSPTPAAPLTQIAEDPSFPDYGSTYSKVDKVGLLAPAAATAAYQLQTHNARPTKPKVRSVVARTHSRDFRSNTAASQTQDDHDKVLDRLGSPDPNFGKTMDTMNQKAGRKSKGNSKATGKKTAFKVELPLPDPVPPPKPKKVSQPAQANRKTVIAANTKTAITAKSRDAFSKLLDDVIAKQLGREESDSDEDEDETSASPSIKMKLLGQVGLFLLRSGDKAFGSQQTLPPGEFQAKLNSMIGSVSTHFMPRITTSGLDAAYLHGMLGEKSMQVEAFYEIFISDLKGWRLVVTVPAGDKAGFTIKSHDLSIGQACLHYPVRVWDARMALIDPGTHHRTLSRDAIAEFVDSMQTDKKAPSFRAFIPQAQFQIERVAAQIMYSYDLGDTTYRLVEIQDLEMSKQIHRKHYNFVARAADDRAEMAARNRLWWEVRLETFDLTKAEQMQHRIDELVKSMDAVGLQNMGPWVRGEKGAEEDEDEESVLPVRERTGNIEW